MVKSSKRVRTEKEREASKQERIAREEGLKFKNGERSAWAPKWLDAKMYKAKRWARKNTQTVFILGASSFIVGMFFINAPHSQAK